MLEREDLKEKTYRNITVEDFSQLLPLEELYTLFPKEQFTHTTQEDETAIKYSVFGRDGKRWISLKLRDRRFDGEKWFSTPLTHEWGYGGPEDVISDSAIETSKYWGDPRYPLDGLFAPDTIRFIENPFAALPVDNPTSENLLIWLKRWNDVISSQHLPYPGQYSLYTINGLNRFVFEQVKTLGKERGYRYLSAVPTWYHVAKINEHFGFSYHDPKDAEIIQKIDDRLLENSHNASWAVMLQFWAVLAEKNGIKPELYVDPHSIYRDKNGTILTYPLTPKHNVWQTYRLY